MLIPLQCNLIGKVVGLAVHLDTLLEERLKVSGIHNAILNRLAAVNVEFQLQLLAFTTFGLQTLSFLSRHLRLLATGLGLGPLCWGFSRRHG